MAEQEVAVIYGLVLIDLRERLERFPHPDHALGGCTVRHDATAQRLVCQACVTAYETREPFHHKAVLAERYPGGDEPGWKEPRSTYPRLVDSETAELDREK